MGRSGEEEERYLGKTGVNYGLKHVLIGLVSRLIG